MKISERKFWIRKVTAIFAVFVFSGLSSGWADNGVDQLVKENKELRQIVTKLTEKVEALESRVTVTEQRGAAPVSVPVPGATAAQAPALYQLQLAECHWPVSGIYTAPDTKDLGQLTGISWLNGTKVRGWVDTNYVYNFNEVNRAIADASQPLSVVKGRDVSVEGRTFDIHHNSFTLQLAELEIEKVPDFGGAGFKFDMAFGETQDIMQDIIKAGVMGPAATDNVTNIDPVFQHASVSYVAPIGRGLRFDVGKFVTHIGGETIETVKNWNYSHSWFYTYAIPFQDTGIHASYPWTDKFFTDFYLLNGWNVTIDNNKGKTFGPSFGWTATPWATIYANYLTGPEQPGTTDNYRHIYDAQIALGPFFDRWNFMVNFDYGREPDALLTATPVEQDANWLGVAGYARYKVTDWFEPSLRYEFYHDPDGFTTGLAQNVYSYTLTFNTKLGFWKSKSSYILLRPEVRWDHADTNFFTDDRDFRKDENQWTASMGLTYLF